MKKYAADGRKLNNYFFAYFEDNLFLLNTSHVASSMHVTKLVCTSDILFIEKSPANTTTWGSYRSGQG